MLWSMTCIQNTDELLTSILEKCRRLRQIENAYRKRWSFLYVIRFTAKTHRRERQTNDNISPDKKTFAPDPRENPFIVDLRLWPESNFFQKDSFWVKITGLVVVEMCPENAYNLIV